MTRGYLAPFEHIIERTIAPVNLAVSFDDAKSHLQELSTDEDDVIRLALESAINFFDGPNGALGRALISQTWKLSVKCPVDNIIRLPILPVQSITTIEYYDTNDTNQSATVGDFYLYKNDDWAYLEPKPTTNWPSTYNREDAIRVTFVAGYGDDDADIPPMIRRGIKFMTRHFYDNRSSTSDFNIKEIPLAVESIINMYKIGWAA